MITEKERFCVWLTKRKDKDIDCIEKTETWIAKFLALQNCCSFRTLWRIRPLWAYLMWNILFMSIGKYNQSQHKHIVGDDFYNLELQWGSNERCCRSWFSRRSMIAGDKNSIYVWILPLSFLVHFHSFWGFRHTFCT